MSMHTTMQKVGWHGRVARVLALAAAVSATVLLTSPPAESRAPLRKWDYILTIKDENRNKTAAQAEGTVFYLPEGKQGCYRAWTSGRIAATTPAGAPAQLLLVGESCDKKGEKRPEIVVATDPKGGDNHTVKFRSEQELRNVGYAEPMLAAPNANSLCKVPDRKKPTNGGEPFLCNIKLVGKKR
jgi:hypothetical protein